MQRVSFFRNTVGTPWARSVAVSMMPRTVAGRIGYVLLGVLAFALTLVIAIPLIILVLAGALGFALVVGVRGAFGRARKPNGVLDGRRNVRVIVRDE